jgi:outer membrane protein assembly factor BamA
VIERPTFPQVPQHDSTLLPVDDYATEQYAAYLLRTTYYQQGYRGAKVEIKQDGTKRLFIVEPGEVFHLNDVAVSGLRSFPQNKLMQGGPKPGDVFSPTRINDWVERVSREYTKNTGPLESVNWGAKVRLHALSSERPSDS